MTSRKYRSEFGLNIFGNFNCLLQQSDLCYLDQDDGFHAFKENPCHIYMICRRPRVTFEPDDFELRWKKSQEPCEYIWERNSSALVS